MGGGHFQAHESARFDDLHGVPLAGFWQRGLGFAIDFFVVIALWAPLELLWARFVSHEWDGVSHFHIEFSWHEWRSLLAAMLYFVLAFYFTNGLSLGKWVSRTRVVSVVGKRLGLWQCVERVLGYGVSLGEIIGFLQYFWAGNRMCVHDRIAETIVVDMRRSARRLGGIDEEDQLVELVEGL